MTQTVLLLPPRAPAAPTPSLRSLPTRPPRRRPALGRGGRAVARILVLALALGAPLAAFAGERKVSVDVEGHVRTIRTYATTARELLERQGIRTHKLDLVSP